MAQQPPSMGLEKQPLLPQEKRRMRAPFETEQKPTPERATIPETTPLPEQQSLPTENIPHVQAQEGLLARFKQKKFKPSAIPRTGQKDETTKKIETVMSEGLAQLYQQMPEFKRVEFKIKGEETARDIRTLFNKPKLHLKKLLKLLLAWLKIIPGVNRFFLEQEAKIKAERLIELHDEEHNRT